MEFVDSPLMEGYVTMLRDKVCAVCEQSEEGIFALRRKADCALDRYFMLVAEAIEEVRAPTTA